MRYEIEFRPSARKELRKLAHRDQVRLVRAVEKLAVSPRPPGVKKLHGKDDLYRVRAGDHRIVYQIQDDMLVVLVVRIGHRREVYG